MLKKLMTHWVPASSKQSVFPRNTACRLLGVAKGQSTVKLQYGKGVIAPYLNTGRITVLSEEGDSSMRFSTDGNLTLFDDFAVSPAFIYEYTKREKRLTEPPLYLIQAIQVGT